MRSPIQADLLLASVLGASTVPIDDVDQLPGILAEFKLKLALFVDDELGSRVQYAAALVLIRVVQIKFASGQIEGFALGVVVGFTESDPAVGGEPDFAAGWRRNQGNVVEVIANCAGDGDAANRLHLGERVDQTLVLALLERSDKDLPVRFRRVLVDDHLNADSFTQLGAGTHRSGVNRLCFPVVRRDSRYSRCEEQREQKTAVTEFPSGEAWNLAVYHRIYPHQAGQTHDRT